MMRSAEGTNRELQFGTLTVQMHAARDDDEFVKIGVLDVRHHMTAGQTKALAQWIILHRIAVLTGFFGNPYRERYGQQWRSHTRVVDPLYELAMSAGAVGSGPLYQMVDMSACPHDASFWTHPSFFLFFGHYRQIKVPEDIRNIRLESGITLGDDLERELVKEVQIPVWLPYDTGSAYVPHLHTIRMPEVEWNRWFNGCWQTWARIGKTSSRTERKEGQRERMAEKREVERQVKMRRRRGKRSNGA